MDDKLTAASLKPLIDGPVVLIPMELNMGPEKQPLDGGMDSGRMYISVSLMTRPTLPALSAFQETPSGSSDQVLCDYVQRALEFGDRVLEGKSPDVLRGLDASTLRNGPIPMQPLRRTLRKSFPVYVGMSLRAETFQVSAQHDRLLLNLEFENTAASPLVSVELDQVQVSVDGAMVYRQCLDVEGDDELPCKLQSREIYCFLYQIAFLDPVVDGAAQSSGYFQPHTQANGQLIKMRAQGRIHLHDTKGALLASKRVSSSWTAISRNMAGPLDLVHGDKRLPTEWKSIVSMNQQGEWLALKTSVEESVYINRKFVMHVELTNFTRRVLNLTLVIPNSDASQSFIHSPKVPHFEGWQNRDKNVPMDDELMMRLYDMQQRKGSAFVCLDTNVEVPTMQPESSVIVDLNFVAIKGAGSVQPVAYLQCVDRETGVVTEINNVLELYVHAPEYSGK